jgi:hypothetical protein
VRIVSPIQGRELSSPPVNVDELAAQAAESVRQVIAEAERRAAEIINAAERQAEDIRARAEAEARDQVEGARRALEELTARFGAAGGAAPASPPEPPPPPPAASTAPPPEPAPVAQPEPPAADPEPPSPAADDSQAARLVAMKMALDGASREEIDAELARSYALADRAALVDEVLAKATK